MSTVILTAGPRGTGKTTYCKKIKSDDTALIIRDEISMSMYGKTWFDSFFEFIEACNVQETFFERAEESVQQKDIIILDIWNSTKDHRAMIINKLRSYGCDRFICWYFTTPLEKCIEWFFQKDDVKIAKFTRDECVRQFQDFHKKAQGIYTEGFDEVIEINPSIIV